MLCQSPGCLFWRLWARVYGNFCVMSKSVDRGSLLPTLPKVVLGRVPTVGRASVPKVLKSLLGRTAQVGILPASLSLAVLAVFTTSASSAPARMPEKVEAVYTISFNGFNIGSFSFEASLEGKSYTLNGDAELSALLGAFKWRGISRASGRVSGNRPKPSDYSLAFKGTGRSGSINVGFDGRGVKSATIVPPIPVAYDEIPLQRKHLSGALDPLTAVMALTFGTASDPCGRRLAIFDGKQRFDLQLKKRGVRAANIFPGETRSRGENVVCSVDYRPLGGFRMTPQTEQLAKSTGIEISMLPVSSSNVAVPQEVRIPTGVGSVILSAEKITITDGSRRKVALLAGN